MRRFWTADTHFSHANIALYCNRPCLLKTDIVGGKWASPEAAVQAAYRMDAMLIRNLNMRIKQDDDVICVGDFLNYGSVKGTPGLRNKPKYYIDQLNGNWVIVEGNHDRNNNVRTTARYMIVLIGPYKALVSHYPIENENRFGKELIDYATKCTDFQICGHVHTAWKHKWYEGRKKPYLMYNVGIDAHKWNPIQDQEIICDTSKLMKAGK